MSRQRTYYERGQPVQVITWWGSGHGPRNVLIEHADGTRVVRPFRGLRRRLAGVPAAHAEPAAHQIRQLCRAAPKCRAPGRAGRSHIGRLAGLAPPRAGEAPARLPTTGRITVPAAKTQHNRPAVEPWKALARYPAGQ